VPPALREHPRALILPHIGSATRGTRGGMMRMALENASAVLGGQVPPNAVNQPVAQRTS
jgi:lactate dehydrogenase-like 2-hydroxyacid dehydrogenase